MTSAAIKTLGLAAMLAAGLTAAPALAQNGTQAPKKDGMDHNVCLWTYMIDHTSIKDKGKAIVFHMKDGRAWKNTLLNRCPGLNFHGFAYVTRDGQICGNMQSIMVLKTHEVCMLGKFEPYMPEPESKPDMQH